MTYLFKEYLALVKRSPFQGLLTLAGFLFCLSLIIPVIDWALINADFIGESRDDCQSGGACWVFIYQRFPQFLVGFYPVEQVFRPLASIAVLILGLVPYLWLNCPGRVRLMLYSFVLTPLISWILLDGRIIGLEYVETAKWGGLLLTILISTVGIFTSFPLGIVLALGRQSKMPVIRSICVAFIELWRGVPLITVLFMASVMLPLFFPSGFEVNKLARCLIGVSLFTSAYMAEVIRGGIASVSKGQLEAARALNLNYFQSMRLVVLPQAIRRVIPGIVNTFIGLFKDTSLVLIISMFDLLGMVQAASTDPDWLGYSLEGYIFAGLIFWIFCFSMSRYSLRIEKRIAY